jgi:hypothetical protein
MWVTTALAQCLVCCATGDLGSIDAKYDIAVSSCSGMLDHIVVDSMPTAQVSLSRGSWGYGPSDGLCQVSGSFQCASLLAINACAHDDAGMRELHPAEGLGRCDLRRSEAAAGAVGQQDGRNHHASGWVLLLPCYLCGH